MGNSLKLFIERFNEYKKFGNARKLNLTRGKFFSDTLSSPSFQPVFFLSTGRTGTTLISNILYKSPDAHVLHDHTQDLLHVSKVSYEAHSKQNPNNLKSQTAATYLAARENDLYQSFLHGKTFIETNNRVTFLAHGIKALIPNAKFVLLYRHPGDFIRSGMRRGYYEENSYTSSGRIAPLTGSHMENWPAYSSEQKIAWLWKETNEFALNFLEEIEDAHKLILRFPFDSIETYLELIEFCGCKKISSQSIGEMMNKKVNAQTGKDYPKFDQWSDDKKEQVIKICSEIKALNINW